MFRVTREIEFCYGHRLLNYDGKCRHLHGHNGRAVITLEGQELDSRGMLVDFAEIKKTVQQWIDDNLDHNMLLCRDDPILPVLEERGERVFVMDCNPTAENIARLIYEHTQAGRAAGRRSRALGDRALLLDVLVDRESDASRDSQSDRIGQRFHGSMSASIRMSAAGVIVAVADRLCGRHVRLAACTGNTTVSDPPLVFAALRPRFQNRQGKLPFLGKLLAGGPVDLVERECEDLHFQPVPLFFSHTLEPHEMHVLSFEPTAAPAALINWPSGPMLTSAIIRSLSAWLRTPCRISAPVLSFLMSG